MRKNTFCDLSGIHSSDKVYGQREEEHPLAQIKKECVWSSPNGGAFASFLSAEFAERARMVEYTTHVVRVKGQRVRAFLVVRPEGQTSLSHLLRSTNVDILFSTGQTQPTILLHTTKIKTRVQARQANVVIS